MSNTTNTENTKESTYSSALQISETDTIVSMYDLDGGVLSENSYGNCYGANEVAYWYSRMKNIEKYIDITDKYYRQIRRLPLGSGKDVSIIYNTVLDHLAYAKKKLTFFKALNFNVVERPIKLFDVLELLHREQRVYLYYIYDERVSIVTNVYAYYLLSNNCPISSLLTATVKDIYYDDNLAVALGIGGSDGKGTDYVGEGHNYKIVDEMLATSKDTNYAGKSKRKLYIQLGYKDVLPCMLNKMGIKDTTNSNTVDSTKDKEGED